jgi:hypothetical protein
MRQAYVQQARLALTPDGDERAPGAAVTVALCGHWDHDGPCSVPHRTDVVSRDDGHVVVRILFACPPEDAERVRLAVAAALDAGELPVPPPGPAPVTRWRVLDAGPAALSEGEQDVAQGFVAAPEG